MNTKRKADGGYIKATKGELIETYCEHEPVTVVQYEGVPGMANGGDKDGDKDGDMILSRIADELTTLPGVRVLIEPTTSKADILRILGKIRRWVFRNWDDWTNIAPEVMRKGLAWYRNDARDMIPLCAFCAGDRDEPLEKDQAVTDKFPPSHCECCAAHDVDRCRPPEQTLPF